MAIKEAVATLFETAAVEISTSKAALVKDFIHVYEWGHSDNVCIYTFVRNMCGEYLQSTSDHFDAVDKVSAAYLNTWFVAYLGYKNRESTSINANRVSQFEQDARRIVLAQLGKSCKGVDVFNNFNGLFN